MSQSIVHSGKCSACKQSLVCGGQYLEMTEQSSSQSSPRSSDSQTDQYQENGESVLVYYANSDFSATNSDQLSLHYGDRVNILEQVNDDWWWAECNGSHGYIPSNHLVETLPEQWENEEYFDSYSQLKLHLEMMKDRPRVVAYQMAIKEAVEFISGKIVLDVGCGTGILSLLAAKDGKAKMVFGVEASDIAEHAASVVCHNNLGTVVTVFHCKMEEVVLPEKVDLIISEWMGTLLIFEMMLECVLLARDKWLKPEGIMWPSHATLYLVPCTAQQEYDEKITFWKNICGLDFSPIIPSAYQQFYSIPIYNHILDIKDCLSEAQSILKLHLKTLTLDDIEDVASEFDYIITKPGTMHGFGSWFDIEFGDIPDCQVIKLSTGPDNPLTHWKQDLLMLDTPIDVLPGDHVIGSIRLKRNRKWRRHITVTVTYRLTRSDQTLIEESVKEFTLWK